jgi:large conductance mechanosensitive channel
MGIAKEFMDFLKEYKIVGLAVAFIMGVAATALIKSLVDNIIMPLITPLLPAGDWKTAVVQIGPFKMELGAFLAEVINFIIIAFVIFLIVKIVIKPEKVTKV